MNWEAQFWKPIKLKNGQAIGTLAQARDLIHQLPQVRRRSPQWQSAADLLARASEASSLIDEALAQLLLALKAEELI